MNTNFFIATLVLILVLGACGTEGDNIQTENMKVSPVDGMNMVYVPEGYFLMGSSNNETNAIDSEKPQSSIYLDAYWIDKTEVTNSNYQKCVQAGKCSPPLSLNIGWPNNKIQYFDSPKYADYPVIQVTWFQAETYCHWAGRRLPTEAEWEKAARGTDGEIYPWGNKYSKSRLNCCDTSSSEGRRSLLTILLESIISVFNNDKYKYTSPADSYLNGASPYGALNMLGNVNEWVADWYDENYYINISNINPFNNTESRYKVVRGGDYKTSKSFIRTTSRNYNLPLNNFYSSNIGFRCAISQ